MDLGEKLKGLNRLSKNGSDALDVDDPYITVSRSSILLKS